MRACTTCLCALSPAPLPMPNASRKYTPCASAPKRRRPIACRRRERTPPALPPERPSCCEGLSQIAEECDRGRGAIAAPAGIDLESDQPVSPESHMVAQQVHQAPGKARRRSTSSRDRTAPPPKSAACAIGRRSRSFRKFAVSALSPGRAASLTPRDKRSPST